MARGASNHDVHRRKRLDFLYWRYYNVSAEVELVGLGSVDIPFDCENRLKIPRIGETARHPTATGEKVHKSKAAHRKNLPVVPDGFCGLERDLNSKNALVYIAFDLEIPQAQN